MKSITLALLVLVGMTGNAQACYTTYGPCESTEARIQNHMWEHRQQEHERNINNIVPKSWY